VPETSDTAPVDRLTPVLRRLGRVLGDLIRRGNRRRVTVHGRDGTVWLRLPLTLAAVAGFVAFVAWPAVVILALVALFVLGVQASVDRRADETPPPSGPQHGHHHPHDAPPSAA
jgi:hypothetical protein